MKHSTMISFSERICSQARQQGPRKFVKLSALWYQKCLESIALLTMSYV